MSRRTRSRRRRADAVERLRTKGAEAIAVAEAFAPDDVTNEGVVAEAAEAARTAGDHIRRARAGCTDSSSEPSLPRSTRRSCRSRFVPPKSSVRVWRALACDSAVMVMRGDGGATDLAGFRRAPARTLYSGPAASVAGALRSNRIDDGVIVEVGGTSTNVAADPSRPSGAVVRAGRQPCDRDPRARRPGARRRRGSMLRSRRNRVYGVGPRSAHIAGLPYACFLARFASSKARRPSSIAPRPGDPDDHLVVRLADGRDVALTNTCAANALGIVEADDYAAGDRAAACRRVRGCRPSTSAAAGRGCAAHAAGVDTSGWRSRAAVMRDHHLDPSRARCCRWRRGRLGACRRDGHGSRHRRSRRALRSSARSATRCRWCAPSASARSIGRHQPTSSGS